MFTGLVQEIGNVTSVKAAGNGRLFSISASTIIEELSVDDSVSINGVCQTVISLHGQNFDVQAVDETLRKTTFSSLSEGSPVNLELAMKLSDRLGGHLVLGHVDGVGTIESIVKETTNWLVSVSVPGEFLRYVIPVGSIAIDGVSLTVARISGNRVTVAIIPHTFHNTIFNTYQPGTKVNLEFDLIGKYIERLLASRGGGDDKIDVEKLRLWGYKG